MMGRVRETQSFLQSLGGGDLVRTIIEIQQ